MSNQSTRLVSFDGTEVVDASVARPERYRDLFATLNPAVAFIPRGAGLSYSAASMGAESLSVDMRRFNRILAFDPETGDVTTEPGISVGALLEFLSERGFFLPVVPGYPDITVGGCIAFDVHGKSQFHSGNFGEWIKELELFHPAHGRLRLSPQQNADLFELTVGGFGLTGVITRVLLRTAPLPGRALELETVAVENLQRAVEVMEARAAGVAGLYSWHNFSEPGPRFGSGFVFVEQFVQREHAASPARPRLALASRAPFALWNRATSRIAMGVYERRQRSRKPWTLQLRPGFFPIEGLEGYYAAFGRRGFREYQLIVPRERWAEFTENCARLFREVKVPVTLASLKLFRGNGRFLRFRGTGVCLAVDVPAGPAALRLFAELDQLALKTGACLNLSKDSRIPAELCQRIFPEYSAFKEQLKLFDPSARCGSRLRARIGV
ncbi:MAG TPA: FAD-binding oxidoreductase [Polyangiaceae bacterium]|nr:FAD-binding oxidoreductase [Polyangiaceae bacterium]